MFVFGYYGAELHIVNALSIHVSQHTLWFASPNAYVAYVLVLLRATKLSLYKNVLSVRPSVRPSVRLRSSGRTD